MPQFLQTAASVQVASFQSCLQMEAVTLYSFVSFVPSDAFLVRVYTIGVSVEAEKSVSVSLAGFTVIPSGTVNFGVSFFRSASLFCIRIVIVPFCSSTVTLASFTSKVVNFICLSSVFTGFVSDSPSDGFVVPDSSCPEVPAPVVASFVFPSAFSGSFFCVSVCFSDAFVSCFFSGSFFCVSVCFSDAFVSCFFSGSFFCVSVCFSDAFVFCFFSGSFFCVSVCFSDAFVFCFFSGSFFCVSVCFSDAFVSCFFSGSLISMVIFGRITSFASLYSSGSSAVKVYLPAAESSL